MSNEHEPSTSEQPEILFFEKTPYMSAELLPIAKNYSVISYHEDDLFRYLRDAKYSVRTFGNTELEKQIGNDVAVQTMLETRQFIHDLLQGKPNAHALFFYMNSAIDSATKGAGMKMALPDYELQERLGTKMFVPELCRTLGLPENPSMICSPNGSNLDTQFDELQKKLGLPFIIQGSIGVSGEDTFLVQAKEDLERAYSSVTGSLKASKYLKNVIPISVHICISNDEIHIEGPFAQLIGFPDLAQNKFQFSGNDTNQSMFEAPFMSTVQEFSRRISDHLKTQNYRGIYGIDYLWDQDTNIPYLQELNTRLVGLTRLLTGIQISQAVYPDLVRHIETFIGKNGIGDFSAYRSGNIDLAQRFSQLLISNSQDHPVKIARPLQPGIYSRSAQGLAMRSPSVFVKDLQSDDVLVSTAANQNGILPPNGVMAKVILPETALESSRYQLTERAATVACQVREFMTSDQ